MTSFISFTMDSFKKRKELMHLFYIQIFASIILYYLVALADILIKTFYNTSVRNLLNASVSSYWGAFFIILTIIAIVFTIGLVLFTIRLMVFYQTKDISVMVAIGGLIEIIENFYLIQLLLMCLFSSIIGIAVAYTTILVIVLISEIIFPIQYTLVVPFPDFQLLLVFIVFFFTTYLISGRMIANHVKKYHEELIADKIDFNNGKDDNIIARLFIWGKKNADGFINLTTRISRLNIMRHSFVFLISLIINVLYSFFLVSLLFGTIIVADTTTNISYTGIGGDNTAMIVNKDYSSFFKDSFYLDSKVSISSTNLDNSYFSLSTVLPVLQSFNITQYDDRVVFIKNVSVQNPPINVNPNDPSNSPQGNYIGSLVNARPLTIALDPTKAIPFWNYYGENPKSLTGSSIFVGEQFAYRNFRSPMNGNLYFDANPTILFTVKSIVMDPLLNGNTLYMNMNTYQQLFRPNSALRNIIFIKVESNSILNQLTSAIEKVNPNLSVYTLSNVLQHNADFNMLISLYLLFVGIPLFAVYFVLSDSYEQQIIEERKHQLNLIKVLGGTFKDYQSIIMKEIDSFSKWGLSIGYVIAMLFIIQMTVPFPVVTIYSLIFSVAILIVPYYISRRRLLKRIHELYENYVEV